MSVVDDETVAKIRQAMAALRPGALRAYAPVGPEALKKPAVSKPAAPKKKVAVVAAAAPAATRPTTPPVAAATPRPAGGCRSPLATRLPNALLATQAEKNAPNPFRVLGALALFPAAKITV